ncbi:hypothetical protein O9X98_15225 [Agrobacterium salinitolerans]|nr:hypothetical protein [Agrobacterium salinitolerans]
MLKPADLTFDCKATESMLGKRRIVAVLLQTRDEDSPFADNLGKHNVSGLPGYFGNSAAECYWEVSGKTTDEVKVDLKAAGFTFKACRDW